MINIPTLWVDFNEVDDRDRVGTTLLNTPGLVLIPEPGSTVILQDDDGSRCWATVVRQTGDYIVCQLLPDTWRDPAPRPRFNAWAFIWQSFDPTADAEPRSRLVNER